MQDKISIGLKVMKSSHWCLVCSTVNWGLACSGSWGNRTALIGKVCEQSIQEEEWYLCHSARCQAGEAAKTNTGCAWGWSWCQEAGMCLNRSLLMQELLWMDHLGMFLPLLLIITSFCRSLLRRKQICSISSAKDLQTIPDPYLLFSFDARVNTLCTLHLAFHFVLFRVQIESWMQFHCCHQAKRLFLEHVKSCALWNLVLVPKWCWFGER